MKRPYSVDPELAGTMLGWAHELLRDSAGGSASARLACRAEAARCLDCLRLMVGTPLCEEDRELVKSGRALLALTAGAIRLGQSEQWTLTVLRSLRTEWS